MRQGFLHPEDAGETPTEAEALGVMIDNKQSACLLYYITRQCDIVLGTVHLLYDNLITFNDFRTINAKSGVDPVI